MKKIILLAAITVFGVATSNEQTAKKAAKKADAPVKVETQKVDGPGMVFENETIDFGTIPHNSDGNREFVFVNNVSFIVHLFVLILQLSIIRQCQRTCRHSSIVFIRISIHSSIRLHT